MRWKGQTLDRVGMNGKRKGRKEKGKETQAFTKEQ
jgi:hypothetical protein